MKHCAALLALATHAANNHVIAFQRPDGTMGSRTVRDAQHLSSRTARQRRQPKPPAEPKPLPDTTVSVNHGAYDWPLVRPTKRLRTASKARRHKRRALCSQDGRPTPERRGRQTPARRRPHLYSAASSQYFHDGKYQQEACQTASSTAVPERFGVIAGLDRCSGTGTRDTRVGGLAKSHVQAASVVAPDPTEELELLRQCGLKVVWPCGVSSASSKGAESDGRELCDVSGCSNRALMPAGSSDRREHLEAAQASAAPKSLEEIEMAAAVQDLQFLHEGGFPVVWPRGHGPGSAEVRGAQC